MGIRLDQLLGRSPFVHVQEMMRATNQVIVLIPRLFHEMKRENLEATRDLAREISKKEGEIDEIKHKIRQIVAESLFFPVQKRDFLELIFSVDSISDRTEKLGKLFTIRVLEYPQPLEEQVEVVIKHTLKLQEYVSNIVLDELPELFEASFRGPEAQAVAQMIQGVSTKAYELEEASHDAMVALFQPDTGLEPTEVFLWNKIIDRLESIGLSLEKTATIIRLLMEK